MSDALTFDAGALARAWLAVSLAAGNDENTPILYGTLLIESYDDGVRLTATDRYMALTSWISAEGRPLDSERAIDEAPNSATVVRDPDGRGRALLTYLRKIAAKAAKDDQPAPTVALRLNEPVDEGDETGFPGMELRQVVIDYPDHEKLALPIVHGDYPAYRAVLLGQPPKEVSEIRIGAEFLARLGQVGKILGGAVHLSFSGEVEIVSVVIEGPFVAPAVTGGVMPIRYVDAEATS